METLLAVAAPGGGACAMEGQVVIRSRLRMLLDALDNRETDEGVVILSQVDPSFESAYLRVRCKESRVYSDPETRRLPFASRSNPHYREWRLRAKSFNRFKNYLAGKGTGLELLDLGCGNGWFAARLSMECIHNYSCMDVNLQELKQGARLFGSSGLTFVRGNIFEAQLPLSSFDLIVLNGSVAYFSDFDKLMRILLPLLIPGGEIHIIDSPFYATDAIEPARRRTLEYYTSLGVPEMSRWYFHHAWDQLAGYKHTVLRAPISWPEKLAGLVFGCTPPFPWIVIQNDQAG